MHLIQIADVSTPLHRQYIKGPRTPKDVARDGYGFTADPAAAWPFASAALAQAKARIVDRHMGWPPCLVVTEAPPAAVKTLGLRLTR